MKKLLITTLVAFVATLSYAQSLGYRNDTDASLTVGTNYTILGRQLGVSLNYGLNKSTKEEKWLLDFILYSRNERLNVDQGAKLLIRTFSGTVIELKQNQDCHAIKIDSDYPYSSIGNYDTIDYMVYLKYFIDGKDLQIIMKEGIQKMRFETSRGMKDLLWEKDEFGALILSEYNLILGKSDFGADF